MVMMPIPHVDVTLDLLSKEPFITAEDIDRQWDDLWRI